MLYEKIIEKYNDIQNISHSLSLINWDQSTYMPKNGVLSHAETIETLVRLAHDQTVSDEFYEMLLDATKKDELEKYELFKQKELLKIKKNVEKQRKIPTELASKLAKTTSLAMSTWENAKKTGNDDKFLPLLKEIFTLKKEIADNLGYDEDPYDALLDEYDEGLKYSFIEPLFNNLEKELKEIINNIKNSNTKIKDDLLYSKFEYDKLWDFSLEILKKIGIVFESFRLDTSAHPFTTTIGLGDVRITTNIKANDFKNGFYSSVHEGGHALYEIGVLSHLKRSPFANLDSLSIHESQSRFYENMIGKSIGFWKTYLPLLKDKFPKVLNNVSLEEFYKAINKVEYHPIRIESDELTYNMHIIIRASIEHSLINNKIDVGSINDVWNEKTKEVLGFYPRSKSEGYLQDIHWSDGLIGYFPTYTLGNLISAQLYLKVQNDIGNLDTIDDKILKKIHDWLDKNIYKYGTQYNTKELVKKVTEHDLDWKPFIDYIKTKYYGIYLN